MQGKQGRRQASQDAYKQFIEENFEQPDAFFDEISNFLDELYGGGNPSIAETKLIYANVSYESWGRFFRDDERVRRLESGTTKWIGELLESEGAGQLKIEVKAALSGPGTTWVEFEVSVVFNLF